ncbi:MAG: hypothetical protein J5603_07775 [Bacteroidales bacterium]|nr:hypothetical protein [Bacteroidales bacterium]
MSFFTISLAGVPIGVSSLSTKVEEDFAEYITSEQPSFTVATTMADLVRERGYSCIKDAEEGVVDRHSSRNRLEKLFLLRSITERILAYNVILMHGAVVAVDGRCYMFTAPSGTGKTTHVKLWLEQLPQAYVLNGDKPFLKVTEESDVLACGVPWRGKEGLGCNEILPLEAICILDRSPENRICIVEPKVVISRLIRQTHIPADPASAVKALQLLDSIVRRVRLYHLECNMDPDAAKVSIDAMLRKELFDL